MNTRVYHVDSTQPVIYKAFIYLTDAPSLEYGPYSFVKRSHKFSKSVYNNLIRNLFSSTYRSADMSIIDKREIVIDSFGDRGDLILSNYNSIHRGRPLLGDRKRVALISNFKAK